MLKRTIVLGQIEDVKKFVNIAMGKNYDIDLTSGKYTVNAKSIMGIFSLDLTKPIVMIAHSDSDDKFLSDIEQFIPEVITK
ncbi:MAG: HPr family phosphocarrier protein [Oscillospiraceae bacterium]|nr:HPr family phosphocarrier protein [Oscillospiraceae bacterium]